MISIVTETDQKCSQGEPHQIQEGLDPQNEIEKGWEKSDCPLSQICSLRSLFDKFLATLLKLVDICYLIEMRIEDCIN